LSGYLTAAQKKLVEKTARRTRAMVFDHFRSR
jgi:hypothetical protein